MEEGNGGADEGGRKKGGGDDLAALGEHCHSTARSTQSSPYPQRSPCTPMWFTHHSTYSLIPLPHAAKEDLATLGQHCRSVTTDEAPAVLTPPPTLCTSLRPHTDKEDLATLGQHCRSATSNKAPAAPTFLLNLCTPLHWHTDKEELATLGQHCRSVTTDEALARFGFYTTPWLQPALIAHTFVKGTCFTHVRNKTRSFAHWITEVRGLERAPTPFIQSVHSHR